MSPLLTIEEARQILKISRVTINQWSKDGLLEKRTVPKKRRVYITRQSVENIINGKT